MNNTLTTPSLTRINVTFPEYLVSELRKNLPPRKMSQFLAEATAEKLACLKKEKAFETLLAAPPCFTRVKNPQDYVRRTRRLEVRRQKNAGI